MRKFDSKLGPYVNKRRKGRPMRGWEDEFVVEKGPL